MRVLWQTHSDNALLSQHDYAGVISKADAARLAVTACIEDVETWELPLETDEKLAAAANLETNIQDAYFNVKEYLDHAIDAASGSKSKISGLRKAWCGSRDYYRDSLKKSGVPACVAKCLARVYQTCVADPNELGWPADLYDLELQATSEDKSFSCRDFDNVVLLRSSEGESSHWHYAMTELMEADTPVILQKLKEIQQQATDAKHFQALSTVDASRSFTWNSGSQDDEIFNCKHDYCKHLLTSRHNGRFDISSSAFA